VAFGESARQMTNGQDTMARFAREHVAPRDLWRATNVPRDLWGAMAAAGLFRIGLTEGGYAAIGAAAAALAKFGGAPGFASAWTGQQLVARFMIDGFGTVEKRTAWKPGLANGELTACVAISEAGAGAHPKLLATTATRKDTEVRLDGTKAWVSNAPLADLFIVFAISRIEGERKCYSAYVVPRNAPRLTLTDGRDLGGLPPSQHCGLRLDGCVVPAKNRPGRPIPRSRPWRSRFVMWKTRSAHPEQQARCVACCSGSLKRRTRRAKTRLPLLSVPSPLPPWLPSKQPSY